MTRRRSRELRMFMAGAGLGAAVAGLMMNTDFPQRAVSFVRSKADDMMHSGNDVSANTEGFVSRSRHAISNYIDRGKHAIQEAVNVGKSAYHDTLRKEGLENGDARHGMEPQGPNLVIPG